MKCLFNYNIYQFMKFAEELKADSWYIFNDDIENRYNKIKNSYYFNELKNKADSNNIQYDDLEIVSWLDNISIIYNTIDNLFNDEEYEISKEALNKIHIIGEYHIPYSNNRADITIVYENKIIIVELSYDKFKNYERFKRKLDQVICYKELLNNLLNNHIEVATYTLIIEPEADENNNDIEIYSELLHDYVLPNDEKCFIFSQFIVKYFQNTKKNALNELKNLEDTFIETTTTKKKKSKKTYKTLF